jgi:diguanylate cyclase (GGDEF)-like protein/PAS domain S-box-containing protein
MPAPPLPDNERHRLESLHQLEILDTPAESCYDRLARMAATMADAPAALVTLLDENRQWVKARWGTTLTCTRREWAFCGYAILQDEPLCVPDATANPRFADNPLVTGDPGILAYCGAPIVLADGSALGSVCALDFQKRDFSEQQAAAIRDLAATASELLETRRLEMQGRRSERFAVATLDALSNHIVIIDQDGRIEAVNEAWRRFARENGAAEAGEVGLNYLEICGKAQGSASEEADDVAKAIRDVLAGRECFFAKEYPCHSPSRSRWFTVTVTPFPDPGGPPRAVVVQEEITDRKLAEHRLRESEQRYALTLESSQTGVWDWDLLTNRVFYSGPWKELLGCEDSALSDSPEEWFCRICDEHREPFREALTEHMQGQTESLDHELRMRRDSGEVIWVLCRAVAVRDRAGRAVRLAGSLADVTELKQTQQQLHWLAMHDPLTGLANRASFSESLEAAIERQKNHPDYQFAVLTLDFDRFKMINDSSGHETGDALLKSAAKRMCEAVRHTDVVARFGGDEFAILLDDISSSGEAEQIAQRLVHLLGDRHPVGEHELVITASVGIACSESANADAAGLLRNADAAMYQAKCKGKNCCHLFDEALEAEVVMRRELERDLWQGRYEEQFRLLYQPILSLTSGNTMALEALVRWEHPRHGLVPPGDFISIAEESGSIVPLGDWILEKVCRQIRDWGKRYPDHEIAVAVNVSMRQLMYPRFETILHQTLSAFGVRPDQVILELTETFVMENRSDLLPVLKRLRSSGVRVALDDFGTGHSSLSRLHELPVNMLKIDRSFVCNMSDRYPLAAVMSTVVSLTETLGMDVIAEGIEDQTQLAELQAMDVGFGQGFYFDKPLSPADVASYLSRGPDRHVPARATEPSPLTADDPQPIHFS